MKRICTALALVAIAVVAARNAQVSGDASQPIIPALTPVPTFMVSTIPANGDLNPYGVAFVPGNFPQGGPLGGGDVLVSNFNARSNLQGTGTTIVRIDPTGQQSLFFQGPANLGLTTALGVLTGGFVLVGSVPTNTPTATCSQEPSGQETGVGAGELLILDRQARIVSALRNRQFLDGPWDLTIRDSGATAHAFISNVLSGTVTRLDLAVDSSGGQLALVQATQIASGYTRRCDPNALVVGPTGVALDSDRDILYVASTGDNAIFAIRDASTATTDHGTGAVAIRDQAHLHGPLALVRAPNGDLITSQGDAVNADPNHPSEIVEYRSTGEFVAEFSIDATPGSAFGLALQPSSGTGFRFAAVDDATNTLGLWVVQ